MKDLTGVILSILFVFVVIGTSEVLKRIFRWNGEATRKFIHIGVSHWWIIAMLYISSIKYAVIPPIIFIIINYISYKKDLIKSMERAGDKADLGTVYFPISLLILILLTWEGSILANDIKYIGAIGILVMGYGDGFAAIIGKKYGRHKYAIYKNTKTIEGSLGMFAFSFLVTLIILSIVIGINFKAFIISLIIASIAAFLEGITPLGFDNLTVPIITSIVSYYFLIVVRDNTNLIYSIAIGMTISLIIAVPAHIKKSLTLSGAVGAVILGTGIYSTSGLYGSSLMVLFFISSSILSHFGKRKKAEVAKQFDKTGNRDFFQVFANGGVGLIYSLIYFITGQQIFLILIGISFAASNADTWSTELGVLNKSKPISLRTFKLVDKGTSGAISFYGTLAGFLGSIFIAFSSIIVIFLFGPDIYEYSYIQIFSIVTFGGFLGGLIDSVLGATVQGIYYSEEAKKETERKHNNGKPNKLIRGFEFIDNDLVNFSSIILASLFFLIIV